MTVYISNADYRRQKTALTRAVNSGDPLKVLDTVEKTLGEWDGKAWPDGWSRWLRALEAAYVSYQRDDDWGLPMPETMSRFRRCFETLA